jgi:TfoX/Sxy family transcriptional regulator of competence genes
MAYDEELADPVRAALAGESGTGERRMFGGLCFLKDGKMTVGITGDELMVRVGPEAHDEALAQPGARPMDFTGRPMQGFVYLAADALRDDAALAGWVRRGLAGAASAPAKKPRKPRAPCRNA